MKRIYTLILSVLGLMLFFVICAVVFYSDKFLDARMDLAQASITSLKNATKDKLRDLKEPVKIIYFVSPKTKMPARLSRLESEVAALVKEMRRQSSNKIIFKTVNPDTIKNPLKNPLAPADKNTKDELALPPQFDPDTIKKPLTSPLAPVDKNTKDELALPRQVVSFNVKTVNRDEYSVNTIWSSILIIYKGEEKVIPNITLEHLPDLEERIIGILTNIEVPPILTIGLSGKGKNEFLKGALDNYGNLRQFDLSREKIPAEADLLFLIQPRLNEENTTELKDFLASGKNVFIFCSTCKPAVRQGISGIPEVVVLPENLNLELLFKDLGVEIKNELVLDEKNLNNEPVFVIVSPEGMNLEQFKGKLAGKVLFPQSTPIEINQEKMSEAGYEAETLVFTSDKAWTLKTSDKGIPINRAGLPPEDKNRGIYNLGTIIQKQNQWEGKIFLFSSEYLFSDTAILQSGTNSGYLKNLLESFVSAKNVFSFKHRLRKKPEVTQLGKKGKLFWRLVVVFLIPALLFFRLIFKIIPSSGIKNYFSSSDLTFFSLLFSGPLLISLTIFTITYLFNAELDLTAEKINNPSPEAKKFIQGIKEKIKINYITSPSEEMPPDGKKQIAIALERLKNFRRISKGKIGYSVIKASVDDLKNIKTENELNQWGIKPFKVKVIREDLYKEKAVYSALVVENGEKTEIIKTLDPANYEQIEFFLVAAIKRILEGRRYSIAFMADQPRLTPAEAFIEYQQRQLIVPKSPDMYSRLKEILQNYGFDVINVPTGAKPPDIAELPTKFEGPLTAENIQKIQQMALGTTAGAKISSQADMVLYIQPFLISAEIKKNLNEILCQGKSLILAAQHFNVQQRKYSGEMYAPVYWPQPQFSRINEFLDPYGVEVKREVLFDQSKKELNMLAQVRGGTYSKVDVKQPFASPFVIRAVAKNFSPDSEITSNLSDLLFISGNRIIRNKEKFSSDLSWKELVSTSDKSWAFDWEGGWLPADSLKGGEYFKEKQPLAVLIEGRFPNLAGNYIRYRQNAKMLIIGCSEMLKNAWLNDAEFEHRKFLLNAIIDFTYGSDFTKIHSRCSRPKKGFGAIDPSQKLLYRALVIFLFPILFSLYGLYRKFT